MHVLFAPQPYHSGDRQVYIRLWAKQTEVPILCIDYSLAPGHKYPRQIHEYVPPSRQGGISMRQPRLPLPAIPLQVFLRVLLGPRQRAHVGDHCGARHCLRRLGRG